MALIAKQSGGASIAPLDEGMYTGVCTWLIDLGEQLNEKFDKVSHRIMLMWDIAGEKITINGEEVNRTVSREYALSLHEKSSLRKDLQTWRGKAFSPEELNGFNLINILGAPCQIQIIHEEQNNKKYARVGAIIAMPKGASKPAKEEHPTHVFDFEDTATWDNFRLLPKWIQEKIHAAENFAGTELEEFTKNNAELVPVEADEDALPF